MTSLKEARLFSLAPLLVIGACSTNPRPLGDDGPAGPCKFTKQPTALDLAWDELDPNGLPVNPRFRTQDDDQRTRNAADYCLPDPRVFCGGFPERRPTLRPEDARCQGPSPDPHCVRAGGDPLCTQQATTLDLPRPPGADESRLPLVNQFHDVVCAVAATRNRIRGHVNWLPVTYSGWLTFESADGFDRDYDLDLRVERLAGLTRYNAGTGYYAGHPGYIHVELARDDSFGHVGYPADWDPQHPSLDAIKQWAEAWDWKDFHALAELRGEWARDLLIRNRRAVVVGLYGLDAEHGGHAELHPAHALAVEQGCSSGPGPDGWLEARWAIFIMNRGHEGFCSLWTTAHHYFDRQSLTLRLPVEGLPAGTDCGPASAECHVEAAFTANIAGVVGPEVRTAAPGDQALVTLSWANREDGTPRTDLNLPVRVNGVVTLRWKGDRRSCPAPPPDPKAADRTTLDDPMAAVWLRNAAEAADPLSSTTGDDKPLVAPTMPLPAASPGQGGFCPSGRDCTGVKAALTDRVLATVAFAPGDDARLCMEAEKAQRTGRLHEEEMNERLFKECANLRQAHPEMFRASPSP